MSFRGYALDEYERRTAVCDFHEDQLKYNCEQCEKELDRLIDMEVERYLEERFLDD